MTAIAPQSKHSPRHRRHLAVSAAATAFLFWLIYLHPAAASSTQYAFLPALNALLNGLSAMALLIGYTFIRARRIQAHRAAMMTAFGFSTLFLVSYILASRAARRRPLPGPRGPAHGLSAAAGQPYHSGGGGAAAGAGDFFLLADRADSATSQGCAVDISAVALCFGYRRHHLGDAAAGA